MYLKEQHYIIEIARAGSLSKAAQQLHISQPALSIFLSNLEASLGCSLFLRSNRTMVPTQAGKLYLDTAAKMLRLEEQFFTQLNQLTNGGDITIRLGVQRIRAAQIIPGLTSYFQAHYPFVKLRFEKGLYQDILHKLEQDELDAAFLPQTKELQKPHYRCTPLQTDHLLVVLPDQLADTLSLRRRTSNIYPTVTLAQLKEQPFILQSEHQSLHLLAQDAFQRWNFQPASILLEGSIQTSNQMTGLGLGISFTMESYLSAGGWAEHVTYCLLDNPPFEVTFSLCCGSTSLAQHYLDILAAETRHLLQNS